MSAGRILAGVGLALAGGALVHHGLGAAFESLPQIVRLHLPAEPAPEPPGPIPTPPEVLERIRKESASRVPHGSSLFSQRVLSGTVHVWLDTATAIGMPEGQSGDLVAFEPFGDAPLPRFTPSGPPPRSWLGWPFPHWRAGAYLQVPRASYQVVLRSAPGWPPGARTILATGEAGPETERILVRVWVGIGVALVGLGIVGLGLFRRGGAALLLLAAAGAVEAQGVGVLGQGAGGGTTSVPVALRRRDVRYRWDARAPHRALHAPGFDRLLDTPDWFEPG